MNDDDGPMNYNKSTMGSGLTGITGSNALSPVDSMSSKQAESYLCQAFNFFDQDKTGFITKQNIKKIMTQYGDIDDVEDEVVEFFIE